MPRTNRKIDPAMNTVSHRRTLLAALTISTAFLTLSVAGGQSQETSSATARVSKAVPRLIKYSGILLDGRGYPITVPVDVTFALYSQQSPGSKAALWQETQSVSPNEKGAYSIYLGAASAHGLPAEVFTAGSAQWLGIKVEEEPEQARVLLASVPYAFKAGDAQTLGGLPASAFALAGSTPASTTSATSIEPITATTSNATSTVTTTGGTSGYVPKFSGTSTVVDSQVFVNSSGVGINTTSPAAVLDVNGDMIIRGSTIVARTGNATSTKGYPSNEFAFYANAYNSSTKVANNPHFQLQSEPVGNNTASTSATFNLLYANGGTAAETGFYLNPNGVVHFAPSQNFPGAGSVTSVGLVAPSDFAVSSPVTSSGNLSFSWNVSPTSSDTDNAIVKRSAVGDIAASLILGTALVSTGPVIATGPVGIGTNTPQAELNLNSNNAANADSLLLGNETSKGLQLRDDGSGVDMESFGVPLYMNYATEQPIYMNTNGGPVAIGYSGSETANFPLVVGGLSTSSIGTASAYFTNDVYIEGSLFLNGGFIHGALFRSLIDDPLDPTNKYLVHDSIESSEALNQYSGNVTTDELGLATVRLPDWFEVENTDFRYQLTVMGERFAQAIVSKKVANHQFTISTNASHVEVSWQVTAKRNDPYAKANPITVELEKPASKRGHYEHPELYGHPELAGASAKQATRPVAVLKP